ncbi:MAG: hypothetical protein AAGN82_23160 [Myxococcota bacterium]
MTTPPKSPFYVGPPFHRAAVDSMRRHVAFDVEEGVHVLDCSHPDKPPLRIDHGGVPIAVASDGRQLALLNEEEETITIIGPTTAVSFAVPEELDGAEMRGAFARGADWLWLRLEEGSDTLWLVDGKSGAVLASTEVESLGYETRLLAHPSRPLVIVESTQPPDFGALMFVEAARGGEINVVDRLDDFEVFVEPLCLGTGGDALFIATEWDLYRYSLDAKRFEREVNANELFDEEGAFFTRGGGGDDLVSLLWTDGEGRSRGCFFSEDLELQPGLAIDFEEQPYGMVLYSGGVAAAPFMETTRWYRVNG